MAVSVDNLLSIISVAVIWGVTNPFMKKGTKGIESVKSSSATNQVFNDTYFLFTNFKYLVPFVINQCGSLLYVILLEKSDLTLIVVVVNSLTFVITAVTGSLLGEDKIHKNTFMGVLLVLAGTAICCYDKIVTV